MIYKKFKIFFVLLQLKLINQRPEEQFRRILALIREELATKSNEFLNKEMILEEI